MEMAFVTAFTLETIYELRSAQGSHSLKLSAAYDLDSEDTDLVSAVASQAGELHALGAQLHRMLTEGENGRPARGAVSEATLPLRLSIEGRAAIFGEDTYGFSLNSGHDGKEDVMAGAEPSQHGEGQPTEVSGPSEPHDTVRTLSPLEAAESMATAAQVLQIREMLFKDEVADEDFGQELKSRFGKYYPEDLTRLQASTVLFEMRNRERFRVRALRNSA